MIETQLHINFRLIVYFWERIPRWRLPWQFGFTLRLWFSMWTRRLVLFFKHSLKALAWLSNKFIEILIRLVGRINFEEHVVESGRINLVYIIFSKSGHIIRWIQHYRWQIRHCSMLHLHLNLRLVCILSVWLCYVTSHTFFVKIHCFFFFIPSIHSCVNCHR